MKLQGELLLLHAKIHWPLLHETAGLLFHFSGKLIRFSTEKKITEGKAIIFFALYSTVSVPAEVILMGKRKYASPASIKLMSTTPPKLSAI